MHRLLKRQLAKLNLSPSQSPDSATWADFLRRVQNSYDTSDQDRYTLERSLALSSGEMQAMHQKQKALLKGQQQSILDTLPDLVFLLDEDGKYLEILASSTPEHLVHSETELINNNFNDFLPADLAAQLMQAISSAIKTESLQQTTYKLSLPVGERIFEGRIVSTGQQVDNKNTVVFLARDITEQHNATQQKQLLHSAVQASSDAIVIVDNNNRVVYANPIFEQITGYSIKELMEEGNGFLRHPTDKALCSDIAQAAQKTDHVQREATIHNRLGDEVHVIINMSIRRNEQKNIANYIVILTDRTQLKQQQDQLTYLSCHDSLTELPNRRMFEARATQGVSHAKRSHHLGALMFLDIDNFKPINDEYGHHIGDLLLKQFAIRLRECCRTEDTIARLGGDEFIIMLENLNHQDEACDTARKILSVVNKTFELDGASIVISSSIGISLFPDQGTAVLDLISKADKAMYIAKGNGGNSLHIHTE